MCTPRKKCAHRITAQYRVNIDEIFLKSEHEKPNSGESPSWGNPRRPYCDFKLNYSSSIGTVTFS
jgi:hypothetical protein